MQVPVPVRDDLQLHAVNAILPFSPALAAVACPVLVRLLVTDTEQRREQSRTNRAKLLHDTLAFPLSASNRSPVPAAQLFGENQRHQSTFPSLVLSPDWPPSNRKVAVHRPCSTIAVPRVAGNKKTQTANPGRVDRVQDRAVDGCRQPTGCCGAHAAFAEGKMHACRYLRLCGRYAGTIWLSHDTGWCGCKREIADMK